MTPDQLERSGRALFGETWRRAFEHEFGLSNRGLRRLLKGDSVIGTELAGRIDGALRARALLMLKLIGDVR